MSIEAPVTVNAGHLIARRLRASGIDTLFTLSGGHLFSIYDGCRAEGVRLIDTRHEQTAAFAAEGWSKVTRVPGIAALTAGPGGPNGMSAMAAAQQNQSPLVVLGGRAPALRWGQGSLQEIDHVPFVAPLTRFAATAQSADAVGGLIDDALRAAVGAPSGVSFIDFPMDHVFSEAHDAGGPGALADPPAPATPDGNALDTAVRLLAEAQRPVIMAGTNVWRGHAEKELRALSESLRIPVLMNGMARGAVPADHDLAFSRARSKALGEADVAVVVGVPMDFRLGFGGVFGAQTKLIVADRAEPDRPHPRDVAAGRHRRRAPGLDSRSTRGRKRCAGRGAGGAGRRPHSAAPDAGVCRAQTAAGPRRDRRHRRGRLRLLRRSGHRQLCAGRVAGQRAVRLPWFGPRLCTGRQTCPARPAGRAGAGRWRIRLLRHGVGHVGAPRCSCRVGDRQQRDLGTGEASDGDAVRLLRGRRAAARYPIRPGGDRARRTRRTGVDTCGAPTRAEACVRCGAACCGQRADRPGCGVPPPLQSGLTSSPRATASAHDTPWKSVQMRSFAGRNSVDSFDFGADPGDVDVKRHDSVDEFRAVAEPLYRRDPVAHTIELTLLRADSFPEDR